MTKPSKPTGYERCNDHELTHAADEWRLLQRKAAKEVHRIRQEVKRRQKQEQKGEGK